MTTIPCRRIRSVVVVAVGLLVALGGVAAGEGEASAPAVMSVSAAEEAVAATLSDVQQIRGLELKQPVPVQVVGDDEVREHALDRLHEFYAEDVIESQQRAYIQLGLLPEGTNVLQEFLSVLEEQAGGFYDPSAKQFYLLDDMPAGLAPMIAAHELTHALEDQYFDLDARIRDALPDDDRAFAVSAVHEGSAMLVMSLYAVRAMAAGTLTQDGIESFAESEAMRAQSLMAMPPALRRSFLAPYVIGITFLTRGNMMAIAGGFPVDDVNRCSKAGPVSSEQILHPEKFWDPERLDEPTPIGEFRVKPVLGRGWKRKASGVLGELVIGVLVDAPTPSDLTAMMTDASTWTNDAAAGWDGDRWELWARKDSTVTLLSTVWDSPEDAAEFHEALEVGDGVKVRLAGAGVAMVSGEGVKDPDRLLELLLQETSAVGSGSAAGSKPSE